MSTIIVERWIFMNQDDLNITRKRTIRVRPFNLSESIEHMKKFHLDDLINLITSEGIPVLPERIGSGYSILSFADSLYLSH